MALIRCGECGRIISSKAVSCPGCGAPVAAPPPSQRNQRPRSLSRRIRRLLPWIALAAFGVWYYLYGDLASPEEKAAEELGRLSPPLSNAAGLVSNCAERMERRDEPGSYMRRQDLAACDAGAQNFLALFKQSPDDLVTKLCGPEGYFGFKRQGVPVFDEACRSRNR